MVDSNQAKKGDGFENTTPIDDMLFPAYELAVNVLNLARNTLLVKLRFMDRALSIFATNRNAIYRKLLIHLCSSFPGNKKCREVS